MYKETVSIIKNRIVNLFADEVKEKLTVMKVDEERDRLRIIFEFEFSKGFDFHRDVPIAVIKDAVEIRHRRPWK